MCKMISSTSQRFGQVKLLLSWSGLLVAFYKSHKRNQFRLKWVPLNKLRGKLCGSLKRTYFLLRFICSLTTTFFFSMAVIEF
jgi:hypothetical protein